MRSHLRIFITMIAMAFLVLVACTNTGQKTESLLRSEPPEATTPATRTETLSATQKVLSSTQSPSQPPAPLSTTRPTILQLASSPTRTELSRVTDGLQVWYTFDEGSGTIVRDRSGNTPPLDLTIQDETAVAWLSDGLAIHSPTILLSPDAATSLIDALMTSHEITVEAWVKPANTTQDGPARIVTISQNVYRRNLTLGQGMWGDLPSSLYLMRLRTTTTDNNGSPSLATASSSLTTDLTHVVYTRDTAGLARIYLDAKEKASMFVSGDFSNWSHDYRLAFANELTEDRPWLGEIALVAIYHRALTPAEVEQNFQAGPQARPMPPQSTRTPVSAKLLTPSILPTATPNPTATPRPTARGTAAQTIDYFPLGIFEDSGMIGGSPDQFEAMLTDITNRGFDSVMFTNNYAKRDASMLRVSDEMEVKVFMMPAGDLNQTWWQPEVSSSQTTARQVAQPIVDLFSPHPSFKGYIVKDEPELASQQKVALMTQALQALDPSRPAMPILIGIDRVDPIFQAAQPEIMLIDVYPAGYDNDIGDFTLTGFGYSTLTFVEYIRMVTENKPATTPLWVILQTHRLGEGGRFSLREPVPAEIRMQNWLAIGEGATGIFWFIYSSQQGWDGLKDNPTLYREVTDLARRVAPLRDTLLQLHKVGDKFSLYEGEDHYISTLATADEQVSYAVVVNRDGENPQKLTITSNTLRGQLRDLETSEEYALGEPIIFQAGDGKILELVTE